MKNIKGLFESSNDTLLYSQLCRISYLYDCRLWNFFFVHKNVFTDLTTCKGKSTLLNYLSIIEHFVGMMNL